MNNAAIDLSGAGQPLRVAYDHRIFVNQRHGGISRYFARLAEHMPGAGITPKIISPLYQSDYLNDLPRGMVWGRQIGSTPRQVRAGIVLDEALARPLASLFGADVVHETYHNPRRVAPRGARVVTSVYDMIHELFDLPDLAGLTRCLDHQLARAEKIICISESTRRDLLRFYPEVEARTEVVLFGFDAGIGRAPDTETSPHPRPYIMYVGMRWRGYKNFAGLLAAYAASPRLRGTFDLVAVGGGAFSAQEEAAVAAHGLEGRVVQRDASDEELWRYYRQAALFAYPSLYEGFGIPPLEAMAADCPVVTMEISSMPEVCGDAAEYASPDDQASLTDALERVLLSPTRAEELRTAGRSRLQRFSWQECARQTAEVYRSLF